LRTKDALSIFAKGGLFEWMLANQSGVKVGNLVATSVLLGLVLILATLALLTVVVPLALHDRSGGPGMAAGRIVWPAVIYFALIGAGFMLLEVALMQRLTVFLGHPVYGLGVVLCAIILSSGVGSFLSEKLPLQRAPWVYLYPIALVVAIFAARFGLSALVSQLVSAAMSTRIAVSIATIFPLGVLLGFFFPTGMHLVRQAQRGETPWYWALNGIFGVLASAVAVLISIHVGISTNFYLAAACYLAAGICLAALVRPGARKSGGVARALQRQTA
jgi:hypothetical protein